MKATVLDIRDQVKGKRGKVIKEMVEMIRTHQLSYDEFIECSKIAREQMKLERPKRVAKPKPLPTDGEVLRFMNEIEKANPEHSLMMKMMLYMGLRTIEIVRIKIEHIELAPGQETLNAQRKGGRNKLFVIPIKIASLLRMYIAGLNNPVYLFEKSYHEPYDESCRGIRKIVEKYRKLAKASNAVHAHAFRHLIISKLAVFGWTAAEMQLVSGHDSVTSLDHYIDKNPETIRVKLNQAVNQVMPGV